MFTQFLRFLNKKKVKKRDNRVVLFIKQLLIYERHVHIDYRVTSLFTRYGQTGPNYRKSYPNTMQ